MRLDDDRLPLLYAIQREIFCERSGRVLDIGRAVLVIAHKGEDTFSHVLDGPAWDEVSEDVTARLEAIGATVETIDGRDYTTKGVRRKRPLVKTGPQREAVVPQILEG